MVFANKDEEMEQIHIIPSPNSRKSNQEGPSFNYSLDTPQSDTALNKSITVRSDEGINDLPNGFITMVAVCLVVGVGACIAFVIYSSLNSDSDELFSPTFCLVAGVLNSMIGSLLSASGYCCQKWAHNSELVNPTKRGATRRPVYIAGLFLLAIGTISAIVNLGLLGQAIQAPFAALTLIYNALLARIILGESYSHADIVSSFLIIAGVAIAVFGVQQSSVETKEYDLNMLLDLYIHESIVPFLYTIGVIIFILAFLRYVQVSKLHSRASGLFCFSISAGLMAGFTSLTVKSVVEVFKGAARKNSDDLNNPISYIFILLIPCSLIPQLMFMNLGFKYFGTLKFVPLYQSFIILGNMLCGIVYFDEMASYSSFSILLFFIGCAVTISGVCTLLAKLKDSTSLIESRLNALDGVIDIDKVEWMSVDVRFMTDFEQCKIAIVDLLNRAMHTIHYSTFLCNFTQELPTKSGKKVTMIQLINEAAERGVKVHILYNPITDYGTNTLEKILSDLHVDVSFHYSVSDLGPNCLTKHFSNNSRYAFHHQKYLCIDGEHDGYMMTTGCDVNEERNSWLKKNCLGYYWHELSVVSKCLPHMYDWVVRNHESSCRQVYDKLHEPAPFPLVNGGWKEENVMVAMILQARSSIHIENQIFISGISEQKNRISEALIDRISRGINEQDDFHAIIVTNAAQQDEPSAATRAYCNLSLEWSLQSLHTLGKRRGITREQLEERLLVIRLEYNGILVKVHSNIIIQDGIRCIRSSSNLADRSLSHRPCDAETGIMIQGEQVYQLQQDLFHMYLCTTDNPNMNYSMKQFLELCRDGSSKKNCCIRIVSSENWNHFLTRLLMLIFICLSEGSTGGRRKVTFTTEVAQPGYQNNNKTIIKVNKGNM